MPTVFSFFLFFLSKQRLFVYFLEIIQVFEEDRCPTNIMLTDKCKHYVKATNSRRYTVYNVNSFDNSASDVKYLLL